MQGHGLHEIAYSFRRGGPNQNGVGSHVGAGNGFRHAASYGNLRSFGHTVVNHFAGNLLAGFAGDKNHASPIFAQHAGKIMSRQAHTTEHVHFIEAQPIRIGNFEKRFDFKDTEIVDKDVSGRNLLD